MNNRTLGALAVGFFVVVLGAMSVAVAAPSASQSREQATDAKLDHLHQARPTAATYDLPSVDRYLDRKIELASVHRHRLAFERFVFAVTAEKQREADFFAGLRAIAAANASAHTRRSRVSHGSTNWSGGPGGVLACIRHRESRGDYGAINPSSGTAGAYQFMPGTWNSTARSAGRGDLVGVNPANASPADQDAMAQHLLAAQGLGPWGGSCG
jgi:soluble lytic murein transglycosylase-like protein